MSKDDDAEKAEFAPSPEDKRDYALMVELQKSLGSWQRIAMIKCLLSGADGRSAYSTITFALLSHIAAVAARTTVDSEEADSYWGNTLTGLVKKARAAVALEERAEAKVQ